MSVRSHLDPNHKYMFLDVFYRRSAVRYSRLIASRIYAINLMKLRPKCPKIIVIIIYFFNKPLTVCFSPVKLFYLKNITVRGSCGVSKERLTDWFRWCEQGTPD